MKKIKVNFWGTVYVVSAKMVLWAVRRMKPGEERINMLRKLSEINNELASEEGIPDWLRMKLMFIYIDLIAIVRKDTEYWNEKNEYIKNLNKQLEEES